MVKPLGLFSFAFNKMAGQFTAQIESGRMKTKAIVALDGVAF
jgi:hypothetical protein